MGCRMGHWALSDQYLDIFSEALGSSKDFLGLLGWLSGNRKNLKLDHLLQRIFHMTGK
jgi:hypothetical protein